MAEMKKLNGCYRARVENNGRDKDFEGNDPVSDPENRFKVQVRVYGVHTFNSGDKQFTEQPDNNTDDIIPIKHLPWAEQCTPLLFNVPKSTYGGIFTAPVVGSWVWVFFEQGDPMSPIYFGGMMSNDTIPDILNLKPDRTRIETKAGHIIEIDDTVDSDGLPDGSIIIKFIAVQGSTLDSDMSQIRIDKDGIYLSAKNVNISALENLTILGSQSAVLNNEPIVTSHAPTVAIESFNMGKGSY
jgi:hypothetical protein